MKKSRKIENTPPEISERVQQLLDSVTCDTRLELALEAITLARDALADALDLTTELMDGHVPDIHGLDEKIQAAMEAIDEVSDETFTVRNRKCLMRSLVTKIEKYKDE